MNPKEPIVAILKANYNNLDLSKLLKPLGGLGNHINTGDKVLLKINLLGSKAPEKAVTTHPALVDAVAKEVKKYGGQPIIGDSPGGRFTRRRLKKTYKASKMLDIARTGDIELNMDTTSRKVAWNVAKLLKKPRICNFTLDADSIIALPKLKSHFFMQMTLASKIMYGVIPGLTKAKYHALYPKKENFAEILLDILENSSPNLFILDGVVGMEGNGPNSGNPVKLGVIMASTNAIALDISVCRMLGIEPMRIQVLKRAKLRGLWPKRIKYPLLSPTQVEYRGFKLPGSMKKGRKDKKEPFPTLDCIGCGECVQICPGGTIHIEDKKARVDHSGCIRCFCCHEICPVDAIELRIRKSGEK